jgi:hypothetical protein
MALITFSVKVSVCCDTSSSVLCSSGRGKGLFPRRKSLHLRHLLSAVSRKSLPLGLAQKLSGFADCKSVHIELILTDLQSADREAFPQSEWQGFTGNSTDPNSLIKKVIKAE